MTHNFDIEIAAKYGVNEAILLNNIYYWVEHNRANDKNFYDGHYWVYNSAKAFNELFPYMTIKQITYALKKLKKQGLILTGNYNNSTYDRTTWYALTEDGYAICQNGKMHLTKMENASDKKEESICQNGKMDSTKGNNRNSQKGEPIPDIKTNNKPDNDSVCDSIPESTQEQAHTHTKQEQYYHDLCSKYGKDFVDERVRRGQAYNGTTWSKIGKWCEQDWKRVQGRASPTTNQFNNHKQQDYDIDDLEHNLLSN